MHVVMRPVSSLCTIFLCMLSCRTAFFFLENGGEQVDGADFNEDVAK